MKKLSFFLMAMLISVMSFADTYTHTFKSGELKVGTVTLSGISWTGEGTVPFWGFDSNNGRGLQIGSGSNPCKAFSLSTSGFEGTITEVVVNASMASGGTAKLSISVGGTSYLSNKALTTTATNYTATGEASGDLVISYTNTAKAFYIKSISVTYVVEENPDAVKYTVTANVNDPAMGKVTGAGEYEEGKTATLTAVPNPAYKFVSWSNGSTDNPLKFTVTEDVELTATFEALPAMTCAEASAAASGATVVLNPFDVVAVVKGAGYIYIKDESGVALIFDYTMDDQLKAGDHVEGFVGVSSPYNGLPELKPSVAFADLTVTPGTAPEPTLFTEVPTKADLNKYVKFENVTLTADATFTTSGATNATMVVNGTNVTLRNAFKLAATLTKDKAYNIVGFVAIYNSSIQVYFLSAEEYVAPVVNHTITVSANPAEAGTVTGAGEYEEGAEAILTATANEGYEFVNWTENEVEVSTDAEYTFEVLADRALVANFKEAEPEIEWMPMELEINNLTTQVMEIGGAKYLMMMGGNEEMGESVNIFLNNYADVDDDYEVNAESSLIVHMGYEFTVMEGTISQTSETEKGTLYTGTIYAYTEIEGETMYAAFTLTMYAAPVTVLVLTDAIVAINEELGTLTFNVATGEGEGYFVELSGYTAPGVHEGPQICLLETPEVVAYTNYAETSVVDGVITLTGEFTSFMGAKFDLTISGKLPGSGTALDNIAVEGKAVKAIINGQLVIIKNGVQYNAQGQVVK